MIVFVGGGGARLCAPVVMLLQPHLRRCQSSAATVVADRGPCRAGVPHPSALRRAPRCILLYNAGGWNRGVGGGTAASAVDGRMTLLLTFSH